MEIQKIFSDLYDEERYYSVLMNEEELALFSEIQKEFASVIKGDLIYDGNGKLIGSLKDSEAFDYGKNSSKRGNVGSEIAEARKRNVKPLTEAEMKEIAKKRKADYKAAVKGKSKTFEKAVAQAKEMQEVKDYLNVSKERMLGNKAQRDLASLNKKLNKTTKYLKRGGIATAATGAVAGAGYGAYRLLHKKDND